MATGRKSFEGNVGVYLGLKKKRSAIRRLSERGGRRVKKLCNEREERKKRKRTAEKNLEYIEEGKKRWVRQLNGRRQPPGALL